MGQRFQTDFLMEWCQISTKYSSCAQGVMVFDSTWGEKAVGLTNFKKKSDPHIVKMCGSKYVVDLDPTLKCQIISIYCPSGPS